MYLFDKEHILPDVAKSMTWSGDCVCVGFKKQYILIHAKEVMSKHLFSGNNQQSTIAMTLPSKEVLVAKDGNLHVYKNLIQCSCWFDFRF
jgi:hypothetical protein